MNVRRLHGLIGEDYPAVDAVRHNWINVGGRNGERRIPNTVHPDRRHGSTGIDADPKCLYGVRSDKGLRANRL